MKKENGTLPFNWVWTTIGDVFEVILGQSPPSTTYNQEGIGLPFFQGKKEFGEKYPTIQKWCTQPKKIAEKEDILLSVRAPVGPTNINPERSCIGRGLAAIRSLAGMPPLFSLYLLRTYEGVLIEKGTGSTFSAITGSRLKNTKIQLPPLNEQVRIVSKIEELFSRLDQGVKNLQENLIKLPILRSSLIQKAYDGSLTKKFRENNNIPKPLMINVNEITIDHKQGYYTKKKYVECGVKLVRISDLSNPHILWGNMPNLNIDEKTYASFKVKKGDFLFARSGAIGRYGIVKDDVKAIFASYLIRFNFDENVILNDYFGYIYQSQSIKNQLNRYQHGIANTNINAEDIKSLIIPLPNIKEQKKIVDIIETFLSIYNNTLNSIKFSIQKCDLLKQSILKRAFSGDLVPQDPSDGLASELLDKIKVEKALLKPSPRRGRQRRKKVE